MTRTFSEIPGPGRTLMIVWRDIAGAVAHTPTSEECHRPRQEAPAADREKTPGRRTPVVIKRGSICPFFKNLPPKKRSSYSRFLAFLGTGWVKAGVKIFLDFKAIGGPYLTSKSGEFRKTGLVKAFFPHELKRSGLRAFPRGVKTGNGQSGLNMDPDWCRYDYGITGGVCHPRRKVPTVEPDGKPHLPHRAPEGP